MKDQTTESVAEGLLRWSQEHGVPKSLHSDQGRQFESRLFQALCKRLGIKKTRTTPYRPQSHGLVERFNRTLKDMLAKYVDADGADWDQYVGFLEMAYNSAKHTVTGHSPYFLATGREMRLPLDELAGEQDTAIPVRTFLEDRMRTLGAAFRAVRHRAAGSADAALQRQPCRLRSYQPGESVLVSDPAASVGGGRKLAPRFKGPGRIIERVLDSDVLYRVELGGKQLVLHHDRLKPFVVRRHDAKPNDATAASQLNKNEHRTGPQASDGMGTERYEGPFRDGRVEQVSSQGHQGDWWLWDNQEAVEEEPPGYRTRSGRLVRPVQPYQAA